MNKDKDHQLKIANLRSYPLTFKAGDPYISEGKKKETTPIEEWLLGGLSFDGLWPMECIIVEAKGRYAQFLVESKKGIRGFIYDGLVQEANRQKFMILRYKTTKLQWYFDENEAKTYFDNISGGIVMTTYMPL